MTTPQEKSLRLVTTIVPAGPAVAIRLTPQQVAELGSAKTPPVTVTIGGHTERLRIASMGDGPLIGFNKQVRAAFGVAAGDEVEAVIALDVAERTVDVPPLLAQALAADPAAAAAFEKLSFTRRKEIARGIADAKQEATRQRRLEKVLAELRG